jgi:hypothetical protein
MFRISGNEKGSRKHFYLINKVAYTKNAKGQEFTRIYIQNMLTPTYTERACVVVRNTISVRENDYIALQGSVWFGVNNKSLSKTHYAFLNILCEKENVIIRTKETTEAIIKSKDDDVESFGVLDNVITKADIPF